jgi:hypothetical protein
VGTGGAGLVATPTPVSGGLQFVELRAHSYDTCGRTTANVLYCWGDNSYAAGGQVGDGTTINRSVPTPVLGGIAFNSLMGGGIDLTCAQSALGQPFCWGAGGEVGDGSGASTTTPVPVHWVQGTAGTPTSLVLTSGNNLSGTAGGSVGPQTVTVRDAFGNGVVGVTVTFAIASGGGTLTGGTAVTGTGGVAIGPAWTLGPTPGVNTMTATLSGVGQVLFTAIGN